MPDDTHDLAALARTLIVLRAGATQSPMAAWWPEDAATSSWIGLASIAGLPIHHADKCPAFAREDANFLAFAGNHAADIAHALLAAQEMIRVQRQVEDESRDERAALQASLQAVHVALGGDGKWSGDHGGLVKDAPILAAKIAACMRQDAEGWAETDATHDAILAAIDAYRVSCRRCDRTGLYRMWFSQRITGEGGPCEACAGTGIVLPPAIDALVAAVREDQRQKDAATCREIAARMVAFGTASSQRTANRCADAILAGRGAT